MELLSSALDFRRLLQIVLRPVAGGLGLKLKLPGSPSHWCGLPEPGRAGHSLRQRRQADAPEVDFATFGLQAERAGGDFHTVGLIDLLTIHPDRVSAALGQNFDAIPFTGGPFGVHWERLGRS